jgi:leader peptidase (prepilin peptidase)/N-methyltransferase
VPNWLFPLIVAPFIGSFAGALVCRLHAGEPVEAAPSRHDGCGCPLAAWEPIPAVGFAFPGTGRCLRDGPGASTHPIMELACLGIAIWSVLAEAEIQSVWLGCALGWTLLTLAWIDWRHMLLLDVLTLPLVIAGLCAVLLRDPSAATEHAVAASAGYLSFRAIETGYRRFRGRDGLGQGDAKLMAAAGAWLGLAALPAVAFTAALFGLVMATTLGFAAHRFPRGSVLPFGPALCAAIWVSWIGLDPIASLMDMLP